MTRLRLHPKEKKLPPQWTSKRCRGCFWECKQPSWDDAEWCERFVPYEASGVDQLRLFK